LHALFCLLGLLLATPAVAATPAEVAVEAARVRDELCSDAAGDDRTLAATRHGEVSAVWGQVSEAYEVSQLPFLLYWRGVLEQCLDIEDKAIADLGAFVAASEGDSTYADLVRDAKRRVRRLVAGQRTTPNIGPPAVISIVCGGSAGVLSALAGWQNSLSEAAEAEYYSGNLQTAEFPGVEGDSVAAAMRRNGLGAAAGALGLSAIAAVVVVATRADGPPQSTRGQPVISVAPHPRGGVVVGLAGQW
jgi:hypothetical protein